MSRTGVSTGWTGRWSPKRDMRNYARHDFGFINATLDFRFLAMQLSDQFTTALYLLLEPKVRLGAAGGLAYVSMKVGELPSRDMCLPVWVVDVILNWWFWPTVLFCTHFGGISHSHSPFPLTSTVLKVQAQLFTHIAKSIFSNPNFDYHYNNSQSKVI